MPKKVGSYDHPVTLTFINNFLQVGRKRIATSQRNFKESNKVPQFTGDDAFVTEIVIAINICVLLMSSKSFSPSLLQGKEMRSFLSMRQQKEIVSDLWHWRGQLYGSQLAFLKNLVPKVVLQALFTLYFPYENLLAIPVSSCQVDRSGMPSELSNRKDINFSHYSLLIRLYLDAK